MPFFTPAGTKVFIGSVLSIKSTDFVSGDFSSQTWTEIGGLTNVGQIGDTNADVSSSVLSSRRDFSAKGTANGGTFDLSANIDTSDAGQNALRAAQRSRSDYAIRVEYPDKPSSGPNPTGSQKLFIGLVMGAPETMGGTNQFASLSVSVKINSNIVTVGASDGSAPPGPPIGAMTGLSTALPIQIAA